MTMSRDFETADPSDLPYDSLRRRYLLRQFWQTASGFWQGSARSTAWLLSAALLLVIMLLLGAAYAMNAWHRAMFDGLQNRDAAAVGRLSLLYFGILAVSVLFSISQVYVRMTLQRKWRAWVSNHIVDRWLTHGRYYQLNLVSGDHANPEYRIADDVRIATEAPVDFVSGVTQALLSAATFIVVLWTIGGALDLTVGGRQIHVPGFLVIAAIVYALVGKRLDGADRQPLRASLGEQEPSRGRIPLCHHAPARKRREHRLDPRRGGRARRRRPRLVEGALGLA